MNPRFKPGDKVRVLNPSPEDRNTFPFWLPETMDEMIGKKVTITEVVDVLQFFGDDEEVPNYPIYDIHESDMSFKESWLEPVG